MYEVHEGLLILEGLSEFKANSEDGALIAEHYPPLGKFFDYFLRCLTVSRGLRKEHGTDYCPRESNILANQIFGRSNAAPPEWPMHKEGCYVCEHTGEVFRFLIDHLPLLLTSTRSYLVANIILAYLRNDPIVEIANIIGALREYDPRKELLIRKEGYFLQGLLAVRDLAPSTKGAQGSWYGLVRRAVGIMGTTKSFMCPLGPESRVYRADWSNELDRFYFMQWSGPKIAGGLKFTFLDPRRYIWRGQSLVADRVIGTDLEGNEQPEWEAAFCGAIFK